jgi:hypothetical protein
VDVFESYASVSCCLDVHVRLCRMGGVQVKTLILVLCFCLQGCASMLDKSHFQDLTVKEGEQSPRPVVIWWLTVSDTQKLQEICKKAEGYKLACATWDIDFSVCQKDNTLSFCKFKDERFDFCVMITHTQTTYNILGHEVRHCFHKHFH